MAMILLIDAIQAHAAKLSTLLQDLNYSVTVKTPEQIYDDLETILPEFDIVITNATQDKQPDWDLIKRLSECNVSGGSASPRLLVVCSTYRGAGPKLRAEKAGCRFVYD